jgi:hypothetical protein
MRLVMRTIVSWTTYHNPQIMVLCGSKHPSNDHTSYLTGYSVLGDTEFCGLGRVIG